MTRGPEVNATGPNCITVCFGDHRSRASSVYLINLTSKTCDPACAFAIERSGGISFSTVHFLRFIFNGSLLLSFILGNGQMSKREVSRRASHTGDALKLAHQPKESEFRMSAVNGDKSRYNRERKQKIARRKRTRELLKPAPAQSKSRDPRTSARTGAVSA
jgi:hypothetical protein